jgi:hypothetical protein
MSRSFLERVNKFIQHEIPNTDEGHNALARDLLLYSPASRVEVLDQLDTHLPPNAGQSEFARHYALKRKLKAAHEAAKKVGR